MFLIYPYAIYLNVLLKILYSFPLTDQASTKVSQSSSSSSISGSIFPLLLVAIIACAVLGILIMVFFIFKRRKAYSAGTRAMDVINGYNPQQTYENPIYEESTSDGGTAVDGVHHGILAQPVTSSNPMYTGKDDMYGDGYDELPPASMGLLFSPGHYADPVAQPLSLNSSFGERFNEEEGTQPQIFKSRIQLENAGESVTEGGYMSVMPTITTDDRGNGIGNEADIMTARDGERVIFSTSIGSTLSTI